MITLKPLGCGFMSFLQSAKLIRCVSPDEVPWLQESLTNFENPHFAILNRHAESFESHIGYTSVSKK